MAADRISGKTKKALKARRVWTRSATFDADAAPMLTVSPQARLKCACPSWTSRRECVRVRYVDNKLDSDDACECVCHEDDETSND